MSRTRAISQKLDKLKPVARCFTKIESLQAPRKSRYEKLRQNVNFPCTKANTETRDLICIVEPKLLQLFSPGKNKLFRRAQSNQVVHGLAEFLFAAQVFFSSLHTDVPQQKLNLFQFTASKVTQAGARAP